MAIGIKNKRQVQRTDKEYFDLWVELGTVEKVKNHLRLAGEINFDTGKPISGTTIHKAAARYVIEHPNDVRPIFEKNWGNNVPDVEWDEYLVRNAIIAYDTSSKRLASWIKRFHMEKYDYLYGKRFPSGKLE